MVLHVVLKLHIFFVWFDFSIFKAKSNILQSLKFSSLMVHLLLGKISLIVDSQFWRLLCVSREPAIHQKNSSTTGQCFERLMYLDVCSEM